MLIPEFAHAKMMTCNMPGNESGEEKEIQTTVLSLIQPEQKQQNGRIQGVVSYSNGYITRGDIGAEVYVLKLSPSNDSLLHNLRDSLRIVQFIGEVRVFVNRLKDIDPLISQEKLNQNIINVFGQEILDKMEHRKELDSFVLKKLFNDVYGNDKKIKTVVDGNGAFSIDVSDGKYCVVVQSKNFKRTGIEVIGAIEMSFVTIEKGNTGTISIKFE